MGIGKTLESIALLDYYDKWPVLILTKKSSCIAWIDEIHHWMSHSIRNRIGLKEKDSLDEIIKLVENPKDLVDLEESDAEIIICNYTFFTEHLDDFKKVPFRFVIADESHALKDKESKRYKAVESLISSSDKCEHLILVSGTPALNNPSELFTQVNLIDPTIFPDPEEYEQRYCNAQLRYGNYFREYKDVSGHSNLDELKLILETVMVRREKQDFPNFFPEKHRELIEIEFDNIDLENRFKKFIKKLKRRSKYVKNNKILLEKFEKKLNTLYGRTCEAKIVGAFSKIEETLESTDEKFIVVAHHTKMINMLEKMCSENQHEFATIYGNKSRIEREESLDKFKNDEECRIMIVSFDTCSGLTLIGKIIITSFMLEFFFKFEFFLF